MWKRFCHFWTEKLWNFHLADVRGWRKFLYAAMRIGSLSIRGFFADGCTLRASSLTYYTLMAIVPILTLLFAIAQGFGYQEALREQLLSHFQEQKTALFEMISFAEKLLEETRGGVIAGIGVAILLWSAVQLLISMEDAFNHIWDIHKRRTVRFFITEYFSWLLLAPLLYVIANSAALLAVRYVEEWIHLSPLTFLFQLLPYALFWFFFSVLYYFLPNAKIRYSSAFLGGVVAGTLYIIAQWGYIYFQVGVSRYGAIYGSFAALPLFLIWVQVSWFLLLFGAEVAYVHQTMQSHEFEEVAKRASPNFRRMLSLWILHLSIAQFHKQRTPITVHWLLHHCRIPYTLAAPILRELCAADLLIQLPDCKYLPGPNVERMRTSDALRLLESHGASLADLPFLRSKELAHFEKVFQTFLESIEKSDQNQALINLSTFS